MDFTLERIGLTSGQSTNRGRRDEPVTPYRTTASKLAARNKTSGKHGYGYPVSNNVESNHSRKYHQSSLPLSNVTSFVESSDSARSETDRSKDSTEITAPVRIDLDKMINHKLNLRRMPQRKPRTQPRKPFDISVYAKIMLGIPAMDSQPSEDESYLTVLRSLELRGNKNWWRSSSKKEQPRIFLPAMRTNGT